jgi:hypothetical protein
MEPEEGEKSRVGALPVARAPRGGGEEEMRPVVEATVAPRQLEGREATGISIWRWPNGQHRRSAEAHRRWGRNPRPRRGRHGEQRRRGTELSAWRGRPGGGGPFEAASGGGRHLSRRSVARATPGAFGAREHEERRGLGRRSVWPTARLDRSGPVKTSGPTRLRWAG